MNSDSEDDVEPGFDIFGEFFSSAFPVGRVWGGLVWSW